MDVLVCLCALIRRFEGLKLSPYRCPAGVLTIGYGHTGSDVTIYTRPISQEKAEALLKNDALYYLKVATKLSPSLLLYPSKQIAIADFCFNLGETRYKASTLRRCINRHHWPAAQEEIAKWVWGGGKKLPGLILRRAAEARLLLINTIK